MITDEMVGDLLTRAFSTVADQVPHTPPLTWIDTKAVRATKPSSLGGKVTSAVRRHRGWTLSIALLAGVGGASAGAAASGVFSSPANHTFKQDYSSPLPAAFGQVPAFNPRKEKLEVVDPGPENTTISVWTYAESSSILCVAGVESKPGERSNPGKPAAKVPVGGCSGGGTGSVPSDTVPPPKDPTYGADGGVWRGYTGQMFFIRAGMAPSGASSVVVTLSNGKKITADVRNGWYAFATTYNLSFGLTGTFYRPNGAAIPGHLAG
jgi:hypothetical protein